MSTPNEQAVELLAAAKRDFVTFHILRRNSESPLETTLFHAQQVAEKSIKAMLVQHGVMFRRTHDLIELFELAEANGIDVPVARDLLVCLGPYAVEFRYLGIRAPDVAPDDADRAVGILMQWASAVLGGTE